MHNRNARYGERQEKPKDEEEEDEEFRNENKFSLINILTVHSE